MSCYKASAISRKNIQGSIRYLKKTVHLEAVETAIYAWLRRDAGQAESQNDYLLW